ncbi:MAG: replication initiation protein [Desulfamplus sp.]|nr:replication initiation protein [Desulfamplus sp.]
MGKKNLVKKANSLVESHGHGSLTLTQQKIIVSIIAQIHKDDEAFRPYELSVSEFKNIAGIKGAGYYSELRRISEELVTKKIVLFLEGDTLVTTWFSSIKIVRKGKIEFRVDPNLKPFLLRLKRDFTKYELENVMKLKSKYSIRLYELLKRHQYQKQSFTWQVELEELKKMLGVEGGKYPRVGDFKKRVLEDSKNEISEKTDILVDYKAIKKGRSVVGFKFECTEVIQLQEPDDLISCDDKPSDSVLELVPLEYRDNYALFKEIYESVGNDGLEFYIKKCNSRKKVDNSSYGGYLRVVFDADLYGAYLKQKKAEEEVLRIKQEADLKKKEKELKVIQQEEEFRLKLELENQMKEELLEQVNLDELDNYIADHPGMSSFDKVRMKKGKKDIYRRRYVEEFFEFLLEKYE